MQIKYRNLDKLPNLTNTEMDLFLYIAKIQNIYGIAYGVHHKAACDHTGMCKQSFYTALRGLEKKGIISISRRSEIDYDVTILDNDFSYDEAWNEGYVKLRRKVFHQKRFQTLKAREKYLLMYFLKITHDNSASYKIGTRNFYKKFCEIFGVTERVVRSYLHSLRWFFSVGIKNGKYFITYRHKIFAEDIKEKWQDCFTKPFVRAMCRRYKVKQVPEHQVNDTADLFTNYKFEAPAQNKNLFELVEDAVRMVAFEEERPKDRRLNAAFVHVKLRELLF